MIRIIFILSTLALVITIFFAKLSNDDGSKTKDISLESPGIKNPYNDNDELSSNIKPELQEIPKYIIGFERFQEEFDGILTIPEFPKNKQRYKIVILPRDNKGSWLIYKNNLYLDSKETSYQIRMYDIRVFPGLKTMVKDFVRRWWYGKEDYQIIF
ncbi:12757_t:CDS:1 [Dentiscutata erythropus]|uniref:12757_t:CDS:1 n=1 Tax=Dentiscutata erythropus TaxID=1348616 RepID=A0A9N9CH51_9GLOM|nr:12757_t:CDS:1 [Dentiscutata erythropus]